MTKYLSILATLLTAIFLMSCGQIEMRKLITEMNANRAKCQAVTKEAQAKAALARKQEAAGQQADMQRTMEEEAELYGQVAKLFNESADKCDKVVNLAREDWYKEYFKLYSKWTRNLAKLASGAQEELLVRKMGAPTEDQMKKWQANIAEIKKEDDTLTKQIAKLESDHHLVPVAHD